MIARRPPAHLEDRRSPRFSRADCARAPRRGGCSRGALCGRSDAGRGAPDLAGRSRRSDRPPVPARRARARPPSGRGRRPDRRRAEEPASRPGPPLSRPRADQARGGLRGLLPLLLPPRNDRPRRAGAERGGIRRRARLCAGASADLGGGADRRRSACPVAAPPRRDDDRVGDDPASQGSALAHPPAGRRAGAGDQGDGARALSRPRQDGLCRAARQPSARADGRRRAPPAGG